MASRKSRGGIVADLNNPALLRQDSVEALATKEAALRTKIGTEASKFVRAIRPHMLRSDFLFDVDVMISQITDTIMGTIRPVGEDS
ncbi:hypothetical protein HY416_02100 [Candidatus Kaiserbacteria bacterium]|nr:hypothetical protein [Candidatus Kaiserbacteria bacterium]